MPTTVEIYFNVDEDHFSGYEKHHYLERVFRYDAIDPDSFPYNGREDQLVAEQAFNLFNAPLEYLTGTERDIARHYRGRDLRSLSVGDVVSVQRTSGPDQTTRWFACSPVGWDHIDTPGNILATARSVL